MDEIITRGINAPAGQNAAFDAVVIALTRCGVPFVVLCVALQGWGQRDRPHLRHACGAAGLSFLIGLAFNQLILKFVHRVRLDRLVTSIL